MIVKPFLPFLILILVLKCSQVNGHKRWSESKLERCSSERQEFNECGTACPPTCYLPNPEFCTRECVARCFCKEGYFEALDGQCYTEQECVAIINAPPNTESHESMNYHLTTIQSYYKYEFFEK
ncbi:venom peptide SjAPI-like [Tetranychus urticae]|uniref:TIL domain-containing protein n=1 Tax=Tetranychus urticae TaxID=32264 RepID=T1L1S0_TETUR|nr:venom peptide SjAPI-like [Tetranychus urticae]